MTATAKRRRLPKDEDNHECRQGHQKIGANVLWRMIKGRVVRSCRTCQRKHVDDYQARAKLERGGGGVSPFKLRNERILPLQPTLMRILIEVYKDGGRTPEAYARRANVELPSVYVLLGRLRDVGLLSAATSFEPHPATGRKVNRARYECSSDGFAFVNAWLNFLQELGPLAKIIRWKER